MAIFGDHSGRKTCLIVRRFACQPPLFAPVRRASQLARTPVSRTFNSRLVRGSTPPPLSRPQPSPVGVFSCPIDTVPAQATTSLRTQVTLASYACHENAEHLRALQAWGEAAATIFTFTSSTPAVWHRWLLLHRPSRDDRFRRLIARIPIQTGSRKATIRLPSAFTAACSSFDTRKAATATERASYASHVLRR